MAERWRGIMDRMLDTRIGQVLFLAWVLALAATLVW